ncbi:FHA domain-containing protein [Streptomyces sp. 6N223]|uniref:FHA domain-containing protein n=1 Tax=Streptomyces sp. 6N223 TaxID=3457412 RepID=UPI003FCF93F0
MPIQIRVTVLGQPGGRGAPGEPGGRGGADVQLTAPENTPLADVLSGLSAAAAPGSGTPAALFCGDLRLDPRRALLGHPPLVDGAVLAFDRPVAMPVPEPVPARLLVVSGPDAGGVHLLRGGEVRIGRSARADVPIDDPDVSRLHCSVSLGENGSVTVTDLGSTNGTLLGGEPVVGGPVRVPLGAALRLGETTLRLVSGGASAGVSAAGGPGDPAVPAGPPSPPVPPVPPGPPVPPQPPGPPRQPGPPAARRTTRGLAGWARRLGGSGETHAGLPLPRVAPGSSEPARQAPPPADPADAAEEARWPDPATLLLTALEPGGGAAPRLWERDAAHPDAFGLRLGTTQRPGGRLAPVVVGLPEAGSLGLAGPRQRLTGLARSLLAQLAALHPPSALELVVVAPGRAEEWSWLGWLPHLRPTRGQDCGLLMGFDRDQAAARVRELAEREAGRDGSGRRTVVLVDGDVGSAPALAQALARLAVTGPAAGIHLLCLAEAPAATPASPLAETLTLARESSPAFAACGAVGLLSGAVASALRLTGTGAAGAHGGGHGPVATVDAVSAAWAERFARALAPVREESAGEAAAADAAGPPASCRLLDVLQLPRVTPGALRERWRRRAGLPLVLGATAEGLAMAELAEAAGPLRVEGEPGSGRTQLLCSLAASLAAAQAPADLSLLLVEGAGEGLRPGAELPHVASYVGATDPVRLRAFAQALRDELKRRAALLGEADFTAFSASAAGTSAKSAASGSGAGGARAGGARVVGQRSSGEEARGEPRGEGDTPAMRVAGSGPLPWLVVLVDDIDALLSPPLGAPGRQAAGSVVRALDAAVRDGHRLGVRLVTAGTPGSVLPQDTTGGGIRVALTGRTPGRAELWRADGGTVAFQAARVTGRIPRTSTLRPTVVRLDWARVGDPPARRPVRELGNGPTDVALLASAAARAAQSGQAATASLV